MPFWLGFQYSSFLVRKMTVVSFCQCQAPVAGLVDLTSRTRSTAFLLATARLKVTMIGMPTPTFSLLDGVTSAIRSSCGALCVANVELTVVDLPSGLVATAVTWYRAPGRSVRDLHLVLSSRSEERRVGE